MTGADRGAIAVIGIAVRFPQADTLERFRRNLRGGVDSVRPMPRERLEATCHDPDVDYPELGYLDRIDLFDHRRFGLSRREAEVTDPHHRLALQLTDEALENAGYPPSVLSGSRTAAVFSSPGGGYAPLVREFGTLSMIGNIPCGLPARVAHLFGFTGPCHGVDTGCNGSLVAVHQACRELRDGEAEYAVAGGVAMRPVVAPAATVAAFPGIASPTARCRAFDAAADGAGAGEGGAVLLLTTLERARREGAFVHAVLRGSAVRHNGHHAATISTPSALSQAEVIRAAWAAADLDPATAGYLEAHGSGTRLGDAVEVEGLGLARPGADRVLPVGSVKTNIGHLDHAAGVAGLVKAVLSVRHGELYPSLHFERPAEDVDLEQARLRVPTVLERWGGDAVRRAGVSSFSLGGINAHCVVEAPPVDRTDDPEGAADGRPVIVAVSARSGAELAEHCERLSYALIDTTAAAKDVALTLNLGRDHLPWRTAVVARHAGELATGLAARATWLRPGTGAPDEARRAAAAADTKSPRVVVLFSDDATVGPTVPEGDALPDELPLPAGADHVARAQLGCYTRLLAAGVVPAALIGSGTGRYLVRHLRGELTADDTATLGAGPLPASPVRQDVLRAAADEQLEDGPVVFVELGVRGELGDLLADLLADHPDADVAALPTGPDPELALLARLYSLGVDLDWTALTPSPDGDGALRVPLPYAPARGERCWARPLGELIAFPSGDLPQPVAGPAPAFSSSAPAQSPAAPPAPAVESAERPPASPVLPPADGLGPPAPAVDVTTWLRDTLAELLYADEVPQDADYFTIGGNSVIALQLVEQVERAHGVALRLVDVYDHPRVGDLAAVIAARKTDSLPEPADGVSSPVTPPPTPAAASTPNRAAAAGVSGPHRLPPIVPGPEKVLSYGQERMWFHHQLDARTTLYNLPGTSLLSGDIDIDAFRLAWEDLAARHEVLRSNFVESDGRPELRIRPELGDFFRYEDVSAESDPDDSARAVVVAETGWVFDIARDPLVRVTVIRRAPREHILCWTMHHAVNDGWAPKILMGELVEYYNARREGVRKQLEPLPVQYRDYARWQRELLDGSHLQHEMDYWRRQLAGAPALDLPTDRQRPQRMDYAGDTHGFVIPGELVTRLRAVGGRQSATLFMVLLSALDLVLARASGQRDIVVGTPTIGRTQPELWGLLGFFNNTVALRSDLSGDPGFSGLVRRVRNVVLGALENQETPFDKVVRELAPRRDPGRNPLVDVMYVHQTLPPGFAAGEALFAPGDADVESKPYFPGLPPGTSKFDLTLVAAERAGQEDIEVVVEYSTQLFDADTVAGLSESFLRILRAVAQDDTIACETLLSNEVTPAATVAAGQPAPSGPGSVSAPEASRRTLPASDPLPVPAATGSATACLRLRGPVDQEALRRACADLAGRQGERVRGELTCADHRSAADPLAAVLAVARADSARLQADPERVVLSALLGRTGDDDQVLTVTAPPGRALSPPQLFEELLESYAAHLTGRRPHLPAPVPPTGSRDERDADEHAAHWRRTCSGAGELELPMDRPRPLAGTGATALHGFRLRLRRASGSPDVPVRDRVLAAVATVVCLRAEADDIVVGLDEGPDTAPLPVRLDLAGDPSNAELAALVGTAVSLAARHRAGADRAAEAAAVPREAGRAPLFDVTYAYRRLPAGLGREAGLEAGPVHWPGVGAGLLDLPGGASAHDLSWTVLDGDDPNAVDVAIRFRTELFDADTVAYLADGVQVLLDSSDRAHPERWPLLPSQLTQDRSVSTTTGARQN